MQWVEPTLESPTLIRLSDWQVIRHKILICVLLPLWITSYRCQNKPAARIRTAPIPEVTLHVSPFLVLFTFTSASP